MDNKRLVALDGLRGIAILLVVFSHLPSAVWYESLPYYLHPIIQLLTGNGKVGVSILFFLTGFLMAWLYSSPKSLLGFWSRRYSRLFPAFLVMVVSWWIVRANPQFGVLESLATVIVCAGIARGLWETVSWLNKRLPVGKVLLIGWMLIQVGVAVWYAGYLLKVPAQVFYQVWDPSLQLAISALVNATLTLPFGNYIGQFDGVYWSLVTEVFFYILYPLIFVPIFKLVRGVSGKWQRIILVGSVLPFCFGLNLLFERILGFRIMLPQLFIYFIFGVTMGLYLPWFQKFLGRFSFLFSGVGLITVLLLNLISVFALQWTHPFFISWYSILLVFPMIVLVGGTTMDRPGWSRWLTKKWLVAFGTISYSLYLTHSLVIDLVKKIVPAETLIGAILQDSLIIGISVLLATCLYWIIEKPYYAMRKNVIKEKNAQIVQKVRWFEIKSNQVLVSLIFVAGLLLLTYGSYRPPLAFFTVSQFEGGGSFLSLLKGGEKYLINDQPLRLELEGAQNNLGMIISSLHAKIDENPDYSDLIIRLRDEQNEVVTENKFNPNLLIDSNFHAFGFPQISDSVNKKYSLEYELVPPNPKITVQLNRMERDFIAVYFVEKAKLFSDTGLFISWFLAKLREPLLNPIFWLNLLMFLPLLSYLVLTVKNRIPVPTR